MVFNVNKQWVLHNCDRKSMPNKYDHLHSVLTINDRPMNFEMFRRKWSLISFILFQY